MPERESVNTRVSETHFDATQDGAAQVNAHYDTRLPPLRWSRRMQIPLIAGAVFSVIRTLGPTLRYEVLGWQHAERVYAQKKRCIFAFWHRVIIPIVWWARNRGIVVMNTTAFDGRWTRKVIEWLGFGTAQGSSSRGGLRGLAVMARRLSEGRDCAFTIDGPRPALRGQARPGDAGAEDRLSDTGFSRRRAAGQNFRAHLGPFFIARAIRENCDALCAAHLRAA